MPVDADVLRCLKRLEMVEEDADLESAQSTLENLIPKTKGIAVAEALTMVAQEYCTEVKPNHNACPLKEVCPTATQKKAGSEKLVTAKAKK